MDNQTLIQLSFENWQQLFLNLPEEKRLLIVNNYTENLCLKIIEKFEKGYLLSLKLDLADIAYFTLFINTFKDLIMSPLIKASLLQETSMLAYINNYHITTQMNKTNYFFIRTGITETEMIYWPKIQSQLQSFFKFMFK